VHHLCGGKKRGGRASRQKGNRAEQALVRFLQERGFAAERVPLSGAARGKFGGDISVPLLGVDRRVEVKARANGFARLYDWLAGNDFLIVKCDRAEPLVVIPLKLAAEIAAKAEATRAPSLVDPAIGVPSCVFDDAPSGPSPCFEEGPTK
jgi:Holliday junction resolvase